MKRKILILIIGVTTVMIFWKWFFNQPCLPPARPKEISKNAVWKGDCDGGYWLEFVSSDKEKVRFRVYSDWNGELIVDDYFKYESCGIFKLLHDDWEKYVAYYDESDESIQLHKGMEREKNCSLIKIFSVVKDESH
jgi:hypothetical protein